MNLPWKLIMKTQIWWLLNLTKIVSDGKNICLCIDKALKVNPALHD